MKNQKVKFDPYSAGLKLGGVATTSGINWSYMQFDEQRNMALFIVDCNNHGYRTRNEHQQDGKWSVQYHHYED
jgi:hypothetical protein